MTFPDIVNLVCSKCNKDNTVNMDEASTYSKSNQFICHDCKNPKPKKEEIKPLPHINRPIYKRRNRIFYYHYDDGDSYFRSEWIIIIGLICIVSIIGVSIYAVNMNFAKQKPIQDEQRKFLKTKASCSDLKQVGKDLVDKGSARSYFEDKELKYIQDRMSVGCN